jgi:hypothetical protein
LACRVDQQCTDLERCAQLGVLGGGDTAVLRVGDVQAVGGVHDGEGVADGAGAAFDHKSRATHS